MRAITFPQAHGRRKNRPHSGEPIADWPALNLSNWVQSVFLRCSESRPCPNRHWPVFERCSARDGGTACYRGKRGNARYKTRRQMVEMGAERDSAVEHQVTGERQQSIRGPAQTASATRRTRPDRRQTRNEPEWPYDAETIPCVPDSGPPCHHRAPIPAGMNAWSKRPTAIHALMSRAD